MKDTMDLARDMALAIMRERTARSSSVAGRDGRQRITFQHMQAMKQLDDAMEAFCIADGMQVVLPAQYTDAEAIFHWTGKAMPMPDDQAPDDLFSSKAGGQ